MSKGLSGLRVLDLTVALSGPFCSLILADLGAEVIKIEPPEGEIFRSIGPYYQGEWSAYFVAINRNKLGMSLDLKSEAGLAAFYDLVRVSDVVLDNYRPGVLERLHIDHTTLSDINPRVVTCSITGFGTGVYRNRTAFDLCVQAASGIMSITGDEEGNVCKVGVPIGDLATGEFAAIGILTALLERSTSGRGQHVDITMFDSQLALLSYEVTWHFLTGKVPVPLGTGHKGLEPYGAYGTADGLLVLAIGTEKFWQRLCDVLGTPHLASDPRFGRAALRQENRRELRRIVEEVLSTATTEEWMARLEEAGIPAAPLNSVDRALAEPCVPERNMLVSVDQPRFGRAWMAGNPVKLSRTSGEQFAPAPALGEHTTELLTRLLGYPSEMIQRMLSEGSAVQFGPAEQRDDG